MNLLSVAAGVRGVVEVWPLGGGEVGRVNLLPAEVEEEGPGKLWALAWRRGERERGWYKWPEELSREVFSCK